MVRRAASISAMLMLVLIAVVSPVVSPVGCRGAVASCRKTVYSPPGIAGERRGYYDRQRTATDRRGDRAQAARLRPGGQSRAVRGGAGAPLRRLPDRRRHH